MRGFIAGLPSTVMTANLWESAGTFRRGMAAKVSFILLNQIDLTLTVLAVYLGFTELNPFVKCLVNVPVALLVFKLFIPVMIAWLIPARLLLPSIGLLSLVAIWNIKELLVVVF